VVSSHQADQQQSMMIAPTADYLPTD